MNRKIRDILQKQAAKNQNEFQLQIFPITKPDAIDPQNSAVFMDDITYFYTFEGRNLFFSKNQCQPVLSLPEATRAAFSQKAPAPNGTVFTFLLTARDHFEYCVADEIPFGERHMITRNVLQAIKSDEQIYYIFKKQDKLFINEVVFDGNSWIGKHIIPSLSGSNVELFPAENGFLYILDGQVYNSKGLRIGVSAVFVCSYGGCTLLVNEADETQRQATEDAEFPGYTLVLYGSGMVKLFEMSLKIGPDAQFKATGNAVVALSNNKFYILKMDEDVVKLVDVRQQRHPVLAYTAYMDQNILSIYMLIDQNVVNTTDFISKVMKETADDYRSIYNSTVNNDTADNSQGVDSVISTRSMRIHPAPSSKIANNFAPTMQTEVERSSCLDGQEAEQYADDFASGVFVDNEATGEYEDDESVTTSDSDADDAASAHQARNNLFDEVRGYVPTRAELTPQPEEPSVSADTASKVSVKTQILGQSRNQESASFTGKNTFELSKESNNPTTSHEPVSTETKHFISKAMREAMKNGSPKLDSPSARSLLDLEHAISSLEQMNVRHDVDNIQPASSYVQSLSSSNKENKPKPQRSTSDKSVKPSDDHNSELRALITESLESALLKNQSLIRDIIVKTFLPVVEAGFNEMKIQMLAEMRKLDSVNKAETLSPKVVAVKRLLDSGKVAQALPEILKARGSELESMVCMLNSKMLDGLESDVLVVLISKLYGLMKKQSKEQYAKLLYDCLVELNISDLSVENLQCLSLNLRYCRELTGSDDPLFTELNYMIDFVCRKIRKVTEKLT